MNGLGTATTTLLITRGLYVDDRIQSVFQLGAGLTPWFGVYMGTNYGNYVAAAGSRPMAPGEIASMFQPIDPNTGVRSPEPFLVPRDREKDLFTQNKVITLKINFAGKQFEAQYMVPEARAKRLVEIFKFVNTTAHKIQISAKGFRRVASTALVEVRNFVLLRRKR